MGGWIGVDLDGTLAEYDGWQGALIIGKPVPKMVQRVKKWVESGTEVRIMTARVYSNGSPERDAEVENSRDAIAAWCIENLGFRLPVTCVKDYGMVELWDDRAVQIIPNTGQRADAEAFESGYTLIKPEENPHGQWHGIGWAVKHLQNGMRIRRAGWNGKGMWLGHVPGDQWGLGSGQNAFDYGAAGPGKLLPWIGMRTAQGDFVPWLASQTDLLAIDWEIAE